MSIKITRRKLIGFFGTTAAIALLTKRDFIDKFGKRSFKGSVKGANFMRGHRLIKKNFPLPRNKRKVNIAIVGAGISGLSSAYHLKKAGLKGVEIFDLEDHLGGKSTSFKGEAPWGAHYLPLPNPQNESLIQFLKDINAITDVGPEGIQFNELMICSDPMEKLYILGRMQEGLVPQIGLSKESIKEFDTFFQLMGKFKNQKGADGKYAFDIPMSESSTDSDFTKYDEMTMKDFLNGHHLKSKELLWYINYCCRDDYGTTIDEISAWAGLHYFCSRRGTGKNLKDESVLTWPEGNHFLAKGLFNLSGYPFHKGHMLHNILDNTLSFYDFNNEESVEIEANHIVLALPQFIIAKILNTNTDFEYSPWMVANIRIRWDEDIAETLAWDNVNYHGEGLGIIVASHQSLRANLLENTLTYYWPLTHLPPKEARKWALGRSHESWTEDILRDISPMIFDIKERIYSIDIWPWGHGMVRPKKNFLFKERLKTIPEPADNITFAHTDLSGLSLFEEGFYQGEKAANQIMRKERNVDSF
ncbi:MAG: FAD-dependent oxidoreductase [Bacteriovoracaceae bacterium]|nr:FAD-dependent oxidoreductase [Bacteriovoracaceae bacterium]